MKSTNENIRLRTGRAIALAAATAVTSVAVFSPEGGSGTSDESATHAPEQQAASMYMQPNAARGLIADHEAVGKTAVYIVKSSDHNAGEIADSLGSNKVEDWINAQNGGSDLIREGQRYAFPVAELDQSKIALTTAEIPTNIQVNADGELAGIGPKEEVQLVTADVASGEHG